MNIFIVGPMGSGKSTVGKIIANELFLSFLDTDDDGDGTITADEIMIEVYSDTSLEALKFTLSEIVLLSNQFISSISSNSGTFNADVVTLVDSNNNGIPNYLDSTESDTIE
jgi:ABC-type oligopeptide transport system ATPase subunit